MKHFLLVACTLLAIACKYSEKKTSVNGDMVKTNVPIPPAASVAEVKSLLAGKSYTTTQVGLCSPFTSDSTIMWWQDVKDTSAMYQNTHKELLAYTLHFLNDTAYESRDGGKLQKGTYTVDNENRSGIMSSDEPEAPGVKLRLTTTESDFGPDPVTFTIGVKGADKNNILLALSRDIDQRKVVVLMKP